MEMLARITTLGAALLLVATPAASQDRGTVEFGGFATGTSFDSSLNMNGSFGAGGRVGIFLAPWLSLEFDGQGSTATRTLGLRDVNVGMVHARVTAIPFTVGPASLLVGVGVNDFDTNFHLSYGVHGLIGAKFALTDAVSLRVDGIQDRMSMGGGANRTLQVGLSYYRHAPSTTVTQVVTRDVPAPAAQQRPDSVSAAETARLRAIEAEHNRMLAANARSDADALTMAEVIHFAHDSSELSSAARTILDSKVRIFRSDPEMRIVITGYASQPGTAEYNMALGLRRAEATRAYLVSQGVAGSRVQIATRGQNELVIDGPGERADAANRRGEFRLLVADPGQ
ncbi:MAG: OmpA family protein [Gemmatimonadales bacterium]|nr:MAG: OmpA family protein [Gemmatimonadales bacterium]